MKIVTEKQYRKDYIKAIKQGKDINKLNNIIRKLVNNEKLEIRYKDHNLIGKYAGCRECHKEPDWLLIYKLENKKLLLYLLRIGSHSDLF